MVILPVTGRKPETVRRKNNYSHSRLSNLKEMLQDDRKRVKMLALHSLGTDAISLIDNEIRRLLNEILKSDSPRVVKDKCDEVLKKVALEPQPVSGLFSEEKPDLSDPGLSGSYWNLKAEDLFPKASVRDRVRECIDELGPRKAFDELIRENNEQILGADLDNGREITRSRCAIYHGLMSDWAKEQREDFGYNHPFAVVAIGGTGRDEMTPFSDTDYAFLFDGAIEGNRFVKHLKNQIVNTSKFKDRCGFSGEVPLYNLDDIPDLKDKQLNAFLDMRPVYDPDNLCRHFRKRIRETYDPFEHFLHVTESWRGNWALPDSKAEQLDVYDIKKDGLRAFLAGVWTVGGKQFRHSHEIYSEIRDPRALSAYYFLLRIRCFIHLKKGPEGKSCLGSHPQDLLGYEDIMSLGELAGPDADEKTKFDFANKVRFRFLSDRRRVDQYTWGVIGSELKKGRVIRSGSAIVYGYGGLRDNSPRIGSYEKSRAALAMLVASQHYGLRIDPAGMDTTFLNAGDWLVRTPELSDLFYESRGSLADSMKFLAQIPDALPLLFPGYDIFEASIDERVMSERKSLRGALLREKLRALETALSSGYDSLNEAVNREKLQQPAFEFKNEVEAAILDDDHLAAIRLAIFTKRLPETPDDTEARGNTSLDLHDRYSSGFSGLSIDRYYEEVFGECGFAPETLEIAKFLVANRRLFKEIAGEHLMSDDQVERIVEICSRDESLIRALYIFTCVDRTEWESKNCYPERWFTIRELYVKAVMSVNKDKSNPTERLRSLGFSKEELKVLRDFGKDFFGGFYRQYAVRFGGYLLKLKENRSRPPKVSRIRMSTSNIVGIATVDHPGIAASISGAFWKRGVVLSQAHLFSAMNHGLALDFFHLAPPCPEKKTISFEDLSKEITDAIVERRYINEEDESNLPLVGKNISLRKTDTSLYQLCAYTEAGEVGALIYYLTCKSYLRLEGNIYGLAAHTGKGDARVSVYLKLPKGVEFEAANERVQSWGVN